MEGNITLFVMNAHDFAEDSAAILGIRSGIASMVGVGVLATSVSIIPDEDATTRADIAFFVQLFRPGYEEAQREFNRLCKVANGIQASTIAQELKQGVMGAKKQESEQLETAEASYPLQVRDKKIFAELFRAGMLAGGEQCGQNETTPLEVIRMEESPEDGALIMGFSMVPWLLLAASVQSAE